MFYEFFKFEFFRRFKQPMIYIFFLICFALVLAGLTLENVTVGGKLPNIHLNSPYSVQQFSLIMTLLGLLMTTAFVNTAALRDFENKFDGLLFTKPIHKGGYILGRYIGATVAACIPFIGVLLACFIAGFEPLAGGQGGPNYIGSYWNAFIVFIVPNVVLSSAIIYALALFSRSSLVAFIGAIGLLVAYIFSGNLLQDLDSEHLASLLDPFAVKTFTLETKYWTISDKNTRYLSYAYQSVLLNRLLWMSVSLVILAIVYFRFSFVAKDRKAGRKKTLLTNEVANTIVKERKAVEIPTVKGTRGFNVALQQLWYQFKNEFLGIAKSTPFIVIAVFGLFNMFGALTTVDNYYGTGNFPVTYLMVEGVESSLTIFLIGIIMYYAGVLVWRERDSKMSEFYDAAPFPSWIPLLSKYMALVGIIVIILLLGILGGMIIQTLGGYTNYELDVYIKSLLGIDLVYYAVVAAAALLAQVLVNNKYIGYFAFTIFFIANDFIWSVFEIDTNLLRFAGKPSHIYSDMNGFEPYVESLVGFSFYWLLFSGISLVLGYLYWVRGRGHSFKDRMHIAKRRLAHGGQNWLLGLGAAFLSVGGYLYYQTDIVNQRTREKVIEERQVDYEKKYKYISSKAQPKIISTDFTIDIYPEDRRFIAKAENWIKNKHHHAIDTIWMSMPVDYKAVVAIENADRIAYDSTLLLQTWLLRQPLEAGDSLLLTVNSSYEAKGIENEVSNTSVVPNGTFVNRNDFMPQIGYNESYEIADPKKREEYDLPKKQRIPKLHESCGHSCDVSYISTDADWLSVNTTISTTADQLAIAPGHLRKQWEENGRRYFRYELDREVLNFFSFISGKYEVAREKWNDVDLEVYYHPSHGANVENMMRSMRKSLSYYANNFLPYPHHEARIIEFPRYASFAQAFPGTMPYSESIGFISDLKEEGAIDNVFYVVAHEMGHQWWAHQVVGANVQGATMLSESFSQYSALMVMEQEYGRDKMQQFLRYELDNYLRRRGSERRAEQPLMYNENQQYLHYNKGSVVLYALRDYISEDSLNLALKRFATSTAFAGPPYPSTKDFMDELEKVTPDSLNYILDDWIRNITLYDNRTTAATAKLLDNGKYEVSFTINTHKYRADSLGLETEVSMAGDYIDVGIYRKEVEGEKYGTPIWLERVQFDGSAERTFKVVVDEKPYQAGIDPRYLLIDKLTEDNLKKVVLATD